MPETIDWPPPRRRPRRRGRLFLVAVILVLLFSGGTALSYYVEALWFDSLGYAAVFWKTLNLQAAIFLSFAAITFAIINGQPVRLPVEPVVRLIALGISLVIGVATGAGMTADWPTFALYWYGGKA